MDDPLPRGEAVHSNASGVGRRGRWELILAHVVLTSLPLIVVYLFVQKRLVSGLSEGAIKG